ncbi:MAG: outer membrane beta-barrel protein [Gammaproteobacteria bacterium]
MFKKIFITILLCLSQQVNAGHFYMGPSVAYNSISNGNIKYQSLAARLALGYGALLSRTYYLAAELDATPNTLRVGRNDTINNYSLENTYSYAAAILPGYLYDNLTLLYLRLGVVNTRFNQLDTTKPGFQLGVGIDMHLLGCWSVRGEYGYFIYRSMNTVGTPKANDFSIGALYRFG